MVDQMVPPSVLSARQLNAVGSAETPVPPGELVPAILRQIAPLLLARGADCVVLRAGPGQRWRARRVGETALVVDPAPESADVGWLVPGDAEPVLHLSVAGLPGVHEAERETWLQLVGLRRDNEILRRRHLRAATEVGRLRHVERLVAALSRALTVPEVGRKVLEHGMLSVDAQRGGVWVVDDATGRLRPVELVGFPRGALTAARAQLPVDAESLAGLAVQSKKLQSVGSLTEHQARFPRQISFALHAAAQAWVAVPVLFEGEPLGAVVLAWTAQRTLAEEEGAYLVTLAHHCAQALERARLFELRQLEVAVRKRAEDQARRSEAQLRLLADALPIAVFQADVLGRLTFCNRTWLDWLPDGGRPGLGRSLEEALGPHAHGLVDPYLRWASEGRAVTFEAVWAGRERRRVVQVHLLPDSTGDGGFTGLLVDISDQRRYELELQRWSDQLEAILRGISDAVAAVGPDGRVVFANRAMAHLLGLEDVNDLTDLASMQAAAELQDEHGRPLPAADHPVLRALAGAEVRGRLFRATPVGSSEPRWLVLSTTPIQGADRNVAMAIVTAHDISDLKQAEYDLRIAREKREAILRNIADAVIVLDAKGHLVFANDAAVQYSPKAQQIGESIERLRRNIEYVDEAGRVLTAAELPSSRALAGQTVAGEVLGVRQDGEQRWMVISATPILSADGQPEFAVVTTHDITERKRWEHELAVKEQQLRLITDAVPLLIVFADHDLRLRFANRTAVQWLGCQADGCLDQDLRTVLGDEAYEGVRPLLQAALGGQAANLERPLVLPATGIRQVQITCVPRHDPAGRVDGLVLLMADLSDRKRAEEALQRSEDQLRQSQKMEAIGRLAGGVAHDFNNLLTAITGYCDLLLSEMSPAEPHAQHVEQIARAGERAASLTRQLLAFSRKQIIAPRVLDLHGVVAETSRMLRRLIGEHIELALDLGATTSRVKMDPGQLEQVILNLAVNARDAMPRGGQLTVSTRDAVVGLDESLGYLDAQPGAYIVLSVRDTGAGIDPADMAHLFEPFFSTKGQGRGTGLGLSTVYGVVKQCHGGLRVLSEPGQGTEFQVFLPSVEAPEVTEISWRQASGLALPVGTERILVAEDEEAVRGLVVRILRGLGYTVAEAPSGEAAIKVFERHAGQWDLLLTDVVMPGINGRQLADALAERQPGLRVLYMSGYTDDAILQLGVLESTASLVNKPFTPQTIAQRVRQMLDDRPLEAL